MKTFSVKQLAEMLDTNPETVRRWIRDKKLNAVQISRKDGNIVTEDELKRFLKATPKYLPRYVASIATITPAIGIPILLGSLLGSKVAGYLDDKKQMDVQIRSEDIEKYLIENIAIHKENIKRRRASIKQIEEEIQSEEQHLQQLQYLLSHKELFYEMQDRTVVNNRGEKE